MFSLEKLCIDLIVQQFERFYFAFTVSKDENTQRNFEFLQRRYSVQLLKALYKDRNLKEEYFEFLINEHLSYFKGKWLKNSRYMNSTDEIFRRLPNLTRIRFKDCGDEILENVVKYCPKIIEIDVNHSKVTDNGVKFLYETKNSLAPYLDLKNIFIGDTNVTDKGAENLIRNLRSLEKIVYPNVPLLLHSISEENLRESENIQFFNLTELDFFELVHLPNYTDVLKSCLKVCPRLETLSCYILDEEDLNVFDNSHLKKLHLKLRNEDKKINMDNFLKINGWKLNFLNVTDCTMSISILGVCCPNLRRFSGCHVNFTTDNGDLNFIFASLTECVFENIEPSSDKAICLLLASSPKLESIAFMFCMLSAEMKNQILLWCKNRCAQRILLIDILKTTLEMAFLKDILLNCPTLKEMRVLSMSVDFEYTEMNETLENIAKRLPNKPLVVV